MKTKLFSGLYSLLRTMKGDKLQIGGSEEYVDVKMLFEYAEDKVPEFAKDIGGIQKPFYRGAEDRGRIDIGRMDNEDKGKIVLAEPKPMFVAAIFQDKNQLEDVLDLSAKINAYIRGISAKGKESVLSFTEGSCPGAIKVSDLYETIGEKIQVSYKIKRGNELVGSNLELIGSLNDLDGLIVKMLSEIFKYLKEI
jgi:hypothetical protein